MFPRPLPISNRLSGANPRRIPSTRWTRGSSAFDLNLWRRSPELIPSSMVASGRPRRPRTNASAKSVKYRCIGWSQDNYLFRASGSCARGDRINVNEKLIRRTIDGTTARW